MSDDLSHIYTHLQRATTKARLESLVRYIRYRFIERPTIIGAFPAIAVAVQNPTRFEKTEGESGMGVLHFDLSKRNRRVLVDGLGRASAALELVEMSEASDISIDAREAIQKLLSEFTLPTVFYVPAEGTSPLTLNEMQQLFHDFNFRVAKVTERHAIALDHSDVYIALANRIGDSDVIRRLGGMERKAASLGSKSSAIIVQQNMLRFVRAATEGERFADSSNNQDLANPKLTEETVEFFEDRIIAFLEAMVGSMGEDAFRDRESIHLSSPGWTAMGVVFNDLEVRLNVPDLEAAAARLGALSWDRSDPLWAEIVRPKVNKNGETVLGLLGGGGAQNRRLMTDVVRRALHIDDLLRDKGLLDEDGAPENEQVDQESIDPHERQE